MKRAILMMVGMLNGCDALFSACTVTEAQAALCFQLMGDQAVSYGALGTSGICEDREVVCASPEGTIRLGLSAVDAAVDAAVGDAGR